MSLREKRLSSLARFYYCCFLLGVEGFTTVISRILNRHYRDVSPSWPRCITTIATTITTTQPHSPPPPNNHIHHHLPQVQSRSNSPIEGAGNGRTRGPERAGRSSLKGKSWGGRRAVRGAGGQPSGTKVKDAVGRKHGWASRKVWGERCVRA